jgi:hypothetical protein
MPHLTELLFTLIASYLESGMKHINALRRHNKNIFIIVTCFK